MPHPQSPYYRRNRLDESAQARHDLVIDTVKKHLEHLPEGLSVDDWAAVADHPELFWIVGTMVSFDGGEYSIRYYDLSDEDIARMQASIDRSVEAILCLAPSDCSDWDKALYVYETLVSTVTYREDEEGMALSGCDEDGTYRYGHDYSRTIYGPLVERWGICVGIAMAMQYLLHRLGIECLILEGHNKAKRGHAWVIANLDGNYCYIDPTQGGGWSSDENNHKAYIAHEFFGYSADDISYWDYYRTSPTIPLPEHIGSECDWFRRTGRFVEEFDASQMDALVERARTEGAPVLEVKCATDDVRDEVKRYLEEEHGLTCYRHRMRTIAAPLEGDFVLRYVDDDGNTVRP